jgi:hypothetical protein
VPAAQLRHTLTKVGGATLVLEGLPRLIEEFDADCLAPGGFGSASGYISVATYEYNPDFFVWGTKWQVTNSLDSDRVVWGGLMLDPAFDGSKYQVLGEGNGRRAEKFFDHMIWQTRDLDRFTAADENPHNYDNDKQIEVEVKGQRIRFSVPRKTTFKKDGSNNPSQWHTSIVWWGEGRDINRVAFDYEGVSEAKGFDLQVLTGVGPSGSLTTRMTQSLNSPGHGGSKNITSIPDNHDMVVFRVRRTTGREKVRKFKLDIKNIRINCLAGNDDTYETHKVVNDIVSMIPGLSGTGVDTSTRNALPLDVDEASAAELLDEIALYDNRYWGIEGTAAAPDMKYNTWGKTEWRLTDPYATVQLQPVERYNRCRVPYRIKPGGVKGWTKQTASPNPLAGLGPEFNDFQIDLDDPLPPQDLAEAFAGNIANDLAEFRPVGTIELITVEDDNSPGTDLSAWRIRAGETIKLVPINLLTVNQSSFESSAASGLTVTGSPGFADVGRVADSSPFAHGGFAYEVREDTASSGTTRGLRTNNLIAASPGKIFSASFEGKGMDASAGSIQIVLRFLDASLATLATHTGPLVSLVQSQYVRTEFTTAAAPANSAFVDAQFRYVATGVGGRRCRFDKLQVEKGNISTVWRLGTNSYNDAVLRIAEVNYHDDRVVLSFSELNPLLERMMRRRRLLLARGRGQGDATLGGFDSERPAIPTGVTAAFQEKEVRGGKRDFDMILNWNQVDQDIEGNFIAIKKYVAEFRPTDNGGTPIPQNQGGGKHRRTVHRKDEDDSSLDEEDTKVWFRKINHPHKWKWEARVKAIGLDGKDSGFSAWTPEARPTAFAPPTPQNLTLELDHRKLHADWENDDPSEAEADAAPSLDRRIAYYKVKWERNNGSGYTVIGGKTWHRSRNTQASRQVRRPRIATFRVTVKSVDHYGNESSAVTATISGRKPGKVRNRSLTAKNRGLLATWDPPDRYDGDGATNPDFDEADVQDYDVELWRSGAKVDEQKRHKGLRYLFDLTPTQTKLSGYQLKVYANGVDGDASTPDAEAGSAAPLPLEVSYPDVITGQLTADKITVGDFRNLVDDPSFELHTATLLEMWDLTGTAQISSSNPRTGARCLRFDTSGSNPGGTALNRNFMSLSALDEVYVGLYASVPGTLSATLYSLAVKILCYDAAFNLLAISHPSQFEQIGQGNPYGPHQYALQIPNNSSIRYGKVEISHGSSAAHDDLVVDDVYARVVEPWIVQKFYGGFARKDSGQSLPDDTNTTINYNISTSSNDPYDLFQTVSSGTGGSAMVLPYEGIWDLRFNIQFAANNTGRRQAWFYNETQNETFGYVQEGSPTAGDPANLAMAVHHRVSIAGSVIRLRAFQNTGSAADVHGNGTDEQTRVSAEFKGRIGGGGVA